MTVKILPGAFRQIEGLPISIKPSRASHIGAVRRLAWGKRGKGVTRGSGWTIPFRTGDNRVQFSIDGDTVVVEKVGHRDGFYDCGEWPDVATERSGQRR